MSRQNPKLKTIRRLRQCKGDGALLEGPHLLEEAIAQGLPLSIVLATPAFLEGAEGREIARRLDPAPLVVEPALLRELSDVDSPQGILAAADLPRLQVADLPQLAGGLYVFAEGLQDPGNLGALARSLEAAGGTALALGPGSAHPHHPRALRASAGSLLRLPVARVDSAAAFAAHLERLESQWLALVPSAGRSVYEFERGETVVLAVGSEGAGLSAETVAQCDLEVSIPMAGTVESLNATVATSIALFEINRRRGLDTPSERR